MLKATNTSYLVVTEGNVSIQKNRKFNEENSKPSDIQGT
jgi:hypothetical protein